MQFNYKHATQCRTMRKRGVSEQVMVEFFAGQYTPSEMNWLITELRDRNRIWQKEHYSRDVHGTAVKHNLIPDEVIARRDHRVMLRPKTITAFICGDPLPGESALDKLCA